LVSLNAAPALVGRASATKLSERLADANSSEAYWDETGGRSATLY
jgi:hypothetical protein